MAPSFTFQGICTWGVWQSRSVFMAQKGGASFFFFIFFFFFLCIANPAELCESKLKQGLVNALAVKWTAKFMI